MKGTARSGSYATTLSCSRGVDTRYPGLVHVQAMEPFFSVLLSSLFLGDTPTLPVIASLLPVVGGVALASTSEVTFNWPGFLAAMGSNVTFQSRNVFSKKFMAKAKVGPSCFVLRPSAVVHVPDRRLLHLCTAEGIFEHFCHWRLSWLSCVTSLAMLGELDPFNLFKRSSQACCMTTMLPPSNIQVAQRAPWTASTCSVSSPCSDPVTQPADA